MTDKAYSRAWWLKQIEAERKAHADFRKAAQVAYDEYRGKDDKEGSERSFYPIFWANTQITHSALYAKTPKPDIRKRYQDSQIPKEVSRAIERAIAFTLDQEAIDDHAHRVVDDFLIAGLGVGKVEYLPVVNEGVIATQRLRLEYIPWNCFYWEPNKDWDDVEWIGIEHFLSKAEVKERFKVTVDVTATADTGMSQKTRDPEAPNEDQVRVYEIWCRKTRTLHWIGRDTADIDETIPDPLNLQGFYPVGRPMMLNVKCGALIPKPDYSYIRPLCRYVDRITKRIHSLTEQIKDVGAYDASFPELAKIADPSVADGTLVGIQQFAMKIAAQGGRASFDAVVATRDNTNKVNVVTNLDALAEKAKAQIFETTGISDIVRGASQASETAAAQQLKGHWANVRLARKQNAVNSFFRDIFRLMAEIVAEHFTPEQIAVMTGVQLTPELATVLRQDSMRSFAIDVETDSTIAGDEAEDKRQRLEFTKTFTDYAAQLFPQVTQGIIPADLAKGVMSIAVGGFKYSAELEDAIEAMPGQLQQLQQLNQQTQQAMQQGQQLQQQLQGAQAEIQKLTASNQELEAFKAQTDAQLKGAQVGKTQAETQKILAEIPAVGVEAEAKVIASRAQAQREVAQTVVAEKAAQDVMTPPAPPPITVDDIQLQFDETGMPIGGRVVRNAQVVTQ